mmetsp:Transcript_14226/g.20747  ORF Transcript_14226/g.20747 Transcript_14226/m.20747 type:complete len:98 (-) Transcript_14226:513-806(-)
MGVSVGCKHLKHTVVNCQESHIKCSTSKIKHQNVGFSSSLVHAVGDGRGCGLVDDTLHLHSRDGTSILGCLTLCIIEVRRNSHYRILNLLSKKGLGS